jgi:hypothetical protein
MSMRLLPLSGIVFVGLVVLTVLIGGSTPDSTASGEKVMSYYNDNEARNIVSSFVLAAAVPFLVVFAVTLATALWPADAGRRPIWELVLIGGSLVTGAVMLVVAATHFALADSADEGFSAAALQGLNALDSASWVAANAGFGLMMLGAAGSFLSRVGAYRLLGWAALVLGIALFIPIADFFALLLTGLWIVVVSLMALRGRPDVAARVAPAPA